MKTIKFFHPEETFIYYIEKSLCKVVYSGTQHQLLLEIQSTEELDHVEGDAYQNEFPSVLFTIDDFPIQAHSVDELDGKTLTIPTSLVEIEDEDGDLEEVYYTSVVIRGEDYDADENQLTFSKNKKNVLCVKWTGVVSDFTESTHEKIPFEIECAFVKQTIEE